MKLLRAGFRGILLVQVTLFFSLLRSLVDLFSSAGDAKARRLQLMHVWAKIIAAVLSIDIKVIGKPPASPFFLASNHVSYIDIIVFGALFPCRFISRGDLAHWPFLGYLSRCFDTIFIDRTRRSDAVRVNAELVRAIRTGDSIVVFPEATTSPGEDVLPFRTPLFQPTVEAEFPVSYAAIKYFTRTRSFSSRENVSWWGEMKFLPHLFNLLQIPEICAEVAFGSHPLMANDRKTLGVELQREVKGLLNQVALRGERCI